MWPRIISAAITKGNIEHPLSETANAGVELVSEEWSPGPGLQYSARWNKDKVLNGSPMEEWEPRWNTTWAMKNETWSRVSFEEAKKLEAESESNSKKIEKGKSNV